MEYFWPMRNHSSSDSISTGLEEIPEMGLDFCWRSISLVASCHSLLKVVLGGGLAKQTNKQANK